MLADGEHDERVPDRVRAAAEPRRAGGPARGERALGEVGRVEDEPGDVGEDRGRDRPCVGYGNTHTVMTDM